MWLRRRATARWHSSYLGGHGSECCAVLPDEVSEGQRGAAAGRFEGGGVGVGPQDRGVVLAHRCIGGDVLDHGVVRRVPGVGPQVAAPPIRWEVVGGDLRARLPPQLSRRTLFATAPL